MSWWKRLLQKEELCPFRALGFTDSEVEALAEAQDPEELAATCLDWAARFLQCEACYAYVWNDQDREYRLTGSLIPTEGSDPEPNYSGLMSGARAGDPVPLSLPPAEVPPLPEEYNLAEHRWVTVPGGGVLALRARFDRRARLAPERMAALRRFVHLITPMALLSQKLRSVRTEGERLQLSLKAAHVATQSLLKPDRSLQVLFTLPKSMLQAEHGSLVVIDPETGSPELSAHFGRGQELGAAVLQAPSLTRLGVGPDQVEGDLPGPLRDLGVQAVVRVPILLDDEMRACAYYFRTRPDPLDIYRTSVLETVADRLAQVFSSSRLMEETTYEYLITLQTLVSAMDSQQPQTQGHSERMARYARMTARELGLTSEQAEAIALGGYLHDVGMSTIDPGIVGVSGRLSSGQYDQIKEHALLGAELVGALQAAMPIAPMIQHHHERWDGHGYPHRLSGREIPLGARVIAACDLFDVKTTSRPHRKPLAFSAAIADLQAAEGSQLDPDVVRAFVRAWKRLGDAAGAGMPAAACWVTKQLPAEVCGHCPNRASNQPQPCWEEPDILCTRHGDTCADCLIYTEALSRMNGGTTIARRQT